jgi:AcrR family transcriptional regulator
MGAERPTQQRSLETQRRILEATISLLDEQGFAGTTTLQVQRRAGVTRGALLHHFPSRNDVLIAAVRHLATARFDQLRGQLDVLPGQERAHRAVGLLWELHEGELFWSAMELWLASRHDVDLRAALLPQERRLGRAARETCDELFGEELTSRPGYPLLREMVISSMRGVALTYAFDDLRSMRRDSHLRLWRDLSSVMLGLPA